MTEQNRILDEVIADCIRKRARAKVLEDEAKELKDEANSILMAYRDSGAITDKTVGMDGVGKITFVTRTSARVDMNVFKTGLVNAGVLVEVISTAEGAATTTNTSTTPQFKPDKGGE